MLNVLTSIQSINDFLFFKYNQFHHKVKLYIFLTKLHKEKVNCLIQYVSQLLNIIDVQIF